MEIILKQFLPFVLLLYTIWFRNKYDSKMSFFVLLTFWGYYTLSSNFAFPAYRLFYQAILVILLLYNLKNLNKLPFNIIKIFFLFLIAILISSLNSLNKGSYIDSLFNYLINASAVIFIFYQIKKQNILPSILLYLSRIGIILSLFAIIVYIQIFNRVELTFSNSNYLAYALGVSFIATLFQNQNRYYSFLILAGIFATSSRSVLIVCIIILLLEFLIKLNKKLILLLPVFLLFIVFLPTIKDNINLGRFENMKEDASILQRIEIIEVSKNIFNDNPINGIGYGQFMYKFSEYFSIDIDLLLKVDEIVTHNDFLRVITELGLIGFLIFVGIICNSIRKSFQLSSPNKEICLYLLCVSLSFSLSHNNLNSFIFWFILVLPLCIYYTKEDVKKDIKHKFL